MNRESSLLSTPSRASKNVSSIKIKLWFELMKYNIFIIKKIRFGVYKKIKNLKSQERLPYIEPVCAG